MVIDPSMLGNLNYAIALVACEWCHVWTWCPYGSVGAGFHLWLKSIEVEGFNLFISFKFLLLLNAESFKLNQA